MLSVEEQRLKTATLQALAAASEGADESGYVGEWRQNLIPGLTPENVALVEAEFSKGKGGEISGVRPKFCAVYSSSAFAANAFGRWRNGPDDLKRLALAGVSGFETLELERACPSGLRGTPPHLDALAVGPEGIVAVESKCTEILSEHRAEFRDVYSKRFDELAHPTWKGQFEELSEKSDSHRFLDAAQLLKHYLGLKNTFPTAARIVLMYVWWEPSNAESLPIFAQHRAEVASFGEGLADPQILFHAESYPELWARWEQETKPAWVPEHIENLRRRYFVHVEA